MEEGTRRVRYVPSWYFGVHCGGRFDAFAEGRDVFLHFLMSMINAKRCAKMMPYARIRILSCFKLLRMFTLSTSFFKSLVKIFK